MAEPSDKKTPGNGGAAAATPPPGRRGTEETLSTPPKALQPTTSLGGRKEPSQPSEGPRRAAFAVDEVLSGRYRIARFIAQGGMGEVYEAEDLALGGHVALKAIRAETAEDARAIDRFKREIQIARKVTHPNVCRIFDIGFHRSSAGQEEVLFLTMELLAGETLSERIARSGPLSTAEALPIVEQMAAALDSAHAAGVIHRDFKSSNVMLVPDVRRGHRAVVTDFGLARGLSVEGGGGSSISDTGAVLGTPAYMAPEQVEGRPLTAAADIYALGIVIYEMLTRARPFEGGSALSMAVRRLTEAPAPPRRHVADLDARWEAVILRCLEREPNARFASAADVVEALHGRIPATPSTTSLTRPSYLRDRRVLMGVGALALAAVAGGWYLSRRAAAPGAAPAGPTQKAPVVARRSLAVLGLKNVSGRPQAEWLSTALAEMLTTELSVDSKLRAISGPEVARARAELGLHQIDSVDRDSAARLRSALGADLLVVGAYTLVGQEGGGLLRIDLRLHEAERGELLSTASASGTEEQLFDLVSRAGGTLREKLGLGRVAPARALEVEASLPSNREAARLYAEGLARLRVGDATAARELLEKAVSADPKHPLPHAALADAWAALGYQGRAREEAQKAAAVSASLPREEQLSIEARYHEAVRDWPKAIEIRESLFRSSPDHIDHGLRLAEAQTQGDKPREAMVTLESLRRLPAPASSDPRIDLAQARALQRLGDYKQEQVVAEQAAGKAARLGERLLLAQARLLQATALQSLGELDKAAAFVEQARGLYEAAGDRRALAQSLEKMANLLYARGDLEGARRVYERSLQLNREVGDERRTAAVLHNMGTMLLHQGKLAEAEKVHEQCLATFRKIGAKYEEAATLTDIGARLQNMGELAAAEPRYREALKLFGELGERSAVAVTLTNLGEVLHAYGDLEEARRMHEEALAINREVGDKAGAGYDLFRLGEVFLAKGDLLAARERYDEALRLQTEVGESIAAADTRLGLATLALAQGNASEAEAMGRQAEETLRTRDALDRAALAQVVVAQSLLAQGKLDAAREMAGRALGISGKSLDRRVRLAVAILHARLKAASGSAAEVSGALRALEQARADAARAGLVAYAFEARLAQGEVALAAGRAAPARAQLSSLQREATAKGFGTIARRASAAVGS